MQIWYQKRRNLVSEPVKGHYLCKKRKSHIPRLKNKPEAGPEVGEIEVNCSLESHFHE